MNEEEIRKYLKNNLRINITKDTDESWGALYHNIKVGLELNGETINERGITVIAPR